MQKINFENLPSKNTPINAENLNQIQTNVENAINSVTNITTGNGTINTNNISSSENNHWEKIGNVVSYSFTLTVKGTWNTTTQFVSGLPKAVKFTRFSGVMTGSPEVPLRFAISTSGEISNQYSGTTPSSGKIIEGHITYIAQN